MSALALKGRFNAIRVPSLFFSAPEGPSVPFEVLQGTLVPFRAIENHILVFSAIQGFLCDNPSEILSIHLALELL